MKFIYTPNNPPFGGLRGTMEGSFASVTMKKRVVITLTNAIDDIHKSVVNTDENLNPKKIEQGKRIIEQLSGLRYELTRDKEIVPLKDTLSDLEHWNTWINTEFKGTTFRTGTWLFAECYFYRRIAGIINNESEWINYNPFQGQNDHSFSESKLGVGQLATRLPKLLESTTETDPIIFHELIRLSLWGNRSDLSLLNQLSGIDFSQYTTLNQDNLKASESNILIDKTNQIWDHVKTLKGGKLDIVLDNSGFELLTDLILCEWLVARGFIDQVTLHAKEIPWFVSDTMPHDVPRLLDQLASGLELEETLSTAVQYMGSLFQKRFDSGQFKVQSSTFWTSHLPYWYLQTEVGDLYDQLSKSDLLIFKGDLNYRKLVYDGKWDSTTSFEEGIGHLGEITRNGGPPVVSLRTAKSDPFIGLPQGKAQEMDQVDPEWRINGKFGLIEYFKH